MSILHAVALNALEDATNRVAQSHLFGEKLLWWLQKSPHASERWFQFEWAYSLSNVLPQFTVRCEKRGQTDVVCYDNRDIAGIEIKWYGNWCINPHNITKSASDIAKIATKPFPAAALLFFLDLKPPTASDHEWITKAPHFCNTESLRQQISAASRSPDFEFQVPIPNVPFPVSCDVLGWYNLAART